MAAKQVIQSSYGTQLGCFSPVKFRFVELPRSFLPLVPLSPCKRLRYCAERTPARYGGEGGD
jgi:hypothetical protein